MSKSISLLSLTMNGEIATAGGSFANSTIDGRLNLSSCIALGHRELKSENNLSDIYVGFEIYFSGRNWDRKGLVHQYIKPEHKNREYHDWSN